MLENLDLSPITDPAVLALFHEVLNLVESLSAENQTLRAENQALRNEIARLKGEQGRPTPRPNRPATDDSSEAERREPRPAWHKTAKTVTVDRVETLTVDPATLPTDAVRKGYAEWTVQELHCQTETVCYRRERWWSPSTHESYLAPLPTGITGHFGPELQALLLHLAYNGNVSQAKLHTLLTQLGVEISEGEVAHLLTEQPVFTAEAEAVGEAGLASSVTQQMDRTPTRVDGVTQQCHIRCNDFYTSFFTRQFGDRQAVLDVLCGLAPRSYQLNEVAEAFLAQRTGHRLMDHERTTLRAAFPPELVLDHDDFEARLAEVLPRLGKLARQRVWDATGVGWYREQTEIPVVERLVTDGAGEYVGVCAVPVGCWVHEGRHYTKLRPVVPEFQRLLAEFRTDFWTYYRALRAYQAQPTAREAVRLGAAFDTLFTPTTGYDALDRCITNTIGRRAPLLAVLDYPDVPLHNNASELGARTRVWKRVVSFGPRSAAGVTAWDAFHTLVATAAKLGVNTLAYFRDRLTGAYALPALADIIQARAAATRPVPVCPEPSPAPAY